VFRAIAFYLVRIAFLFTLPYSQFTTDVITVDLDNPLKQGDIISAIHYKEQMSIDYYMRNVVRIDIDNLDFRDVVKGLYQLRLPEDRPNCLELTIPVCGFGRRDAVAANLLLVEETRLNRANPRIQELIDVTRNAIRPNDTKVYLIQFPETMEMSNDLFSAGSRNGVVKISMIPIESDFLFNGHTFSMTNTHVTWMLRVLQEKEMVVNNGVELTAEEMMIRQMAGTTMNDDA
jgi:hypothetical protein